MAKLSDYIRGMALGVGSSLTGQNYLDNYLNRKEVEKENLKKQAAYTKLQSVLKEGGRKGLGEYISENPSDEYFMEAAGDYVNLQKSISPKKLNPTDYNRAYSLAEDWARGKTGLTTFEGVPQESVKDYLPQAMKFLESGELDDTGENQIELPINIKTTSEAKDYLINNYGLSEEDAINWLRSNL